MSTHRTVLVVSDSDENDREYEHQLQQDRTVAYRILKCQTPILALSQLQQVDAILLELHFPHSNSVTLLRQLKEQMGDRCPPIVVIDDEDTKTAVQAFKNGAADYLVRDQITPDDLRLSLRNAIENAELRRELQRSQEQFQTSVENMLDCFGIFSAIRDRSGQILDFRIDYLNAAACENNQMPKEMQIGRGLCEVLPGHRESGLFDAYCYVVETGEPLIKDSLIYDDTYADRRLVRAFDIRVTKLNDGFVASWRDVTDRKYLELELNQTVIDLKQQRNRLKRLIDTAPIGIGIATAGGDVSVINDAMLHLHGYSREEFEQHGMNWCDFAPPELSAQTEQAMEHLRQQGTLPPGEKELIRRDGTRLPIWISATQWVDGIDEHVAFAIDLSQQKQAEAAIQQLNQELTDRVLELQTLLEILPVGVAIATNPACTEMQSNAYIREMLGTRSGENISKTAPTTEQPSYRTFQNGQEIPPENLPMQIAARLGVEVRDVEFDILLPDGAIRQLLCYATPLRDDQNQIRGAIGAFLDISERSQSAAALKASQQRYQALAEAMPQMVWTADATGDVNYWNQRWYEYTGFSEAESMGLAGLSALHPDDRDRTLSQWSTSLLNQAPLEIEYRIRSHKGEYHWFICRAVPTQDDQGQTTGWIGTVTDIDRRKQAELALQQSQERLNLAMKAAKMGSWDWDLQTNRVHWSTNLEHLFGMAPGSFDGRYETVRSMIHPDDLPWIEQAIQPALHDREEYNIEFRFILPDGTVRWALGLGQVFYDAAGNPVKMAGVDMDITERKQSAESLRASEQRFRLMADNAPMMIWVADTTGHCTYLSKRWYEFTGQSEVAGLGLGWLDAVHSEDYEATRTIFLNAVERHEAFQTEYRLRGQDGNYRWVIGAGHPWTDPESHQFKGHISSIVDIHDRKLAEEALHQSEDRLRIAIASAQLGTWDWNLITRELTWDVGCKAILGLPPEADASLEVFFEALHPDDRDRAEQAMQWSINSASGGDYDVEYRTIGIQDRIERWIRAKGQAYFDATGKPLRMIGTILDITEQKRSEAALAERRDHIELLYETTRDLLSSTQPLALIETVFSKLKERVGLDVYLNYILDESQQKLRLANYGGIPEDVAQQIKWLNIGQAICGTVAQERRQIVRAEIQQSDEPKLELARSLGATACASQPLVVREKLLGTLSFGSLSRTEFTASEQSLFQAICDQIAIALERSELLNSLQQQTEELVRVNRIKDEFLAILSHELRSPLNPILGWTKLLQAGKVNAAQMPQALATIERNANLQTQLIDDLLDVAKILRGKLTLNINSVNLSFVIEAAIETVRTASTAKAISLHSVLPNIGQVRGDAARLQQVVWNLLSNAIKFTPNSGQIDIHLEQVGNQAQLTISDTGKGISPEFLPHIFESFQQEDASITRKYGGLGLGLAIVRQLVEAHGGTITADSPGEELGATFTVLLTLLNVEPAIEPSIEPPHQELDLTGIRVLGVDDEPDARDLLAVLLTQYGAEVLIVTSAAEVLSNLPSFQPNILVSDIGMPQVDGYTLIQQVRSLPVEQGGQIPAIALTAYAREDDHNRAINSGYQRHITKPLDPEQLVQAIITLID
ncbi:PAS domain S-box protein [Leptolyngbya sp. DQ-M1]|uniref:PAS domain S-box protein n=1 Tax=Leptolyngbya sp. DQ-M1 TaxID=2933920 RepID=UPI00329A7761